MKKLVLIAVWASILTIFLAFNYLLWERENAKAGGDASVGSSADRTNTAAKTLEDSNNKLQKENDLLKNYNIRYQEDIRLKNILIYELKQKVDLSFLKDIIRLWVKSVNDKDYRTAFRLFSNSMIYQQEYTLKMSEYFKSYNEQITSIKLSSVNLDLDDVSNGKNGDIVLKAVLDVALKNPQSKSAYQEGSNIRYFTIIYDDIVEDWFISGISDKP